MGFSRQEYWNGFPLPSPKGILSTSLQCNKPSFLGPEDTVLKLLALFMLRSAPRLATQPMCISSRPKPWISSVRRSHFPFPPLHLHVTCYSPFFPSLNIDGLEVDSTQEGASQTLPSRDLGSARGTTSRVALGEGICSAWESQSFMEQVGGSFDR